MTSSECNRNYGLHYYSNHETDDGQSALDCLYSPKYSTKQDKKEAIPETSKQINIEIGWGWSLYILHLELMLQIRVKP
jgi:hypothetical protein